ncbi:Transcription factor MYB88 [Linum grandiflorum]
MEEDKKKKMMINGGGGGSTGSDESIKKKERHIVTWSSEEDDILRQQIGLHGTENWAIIASKFTDKTTRQCRRRWFTYLNSDFKKGGWSPEEDLLLCEAQRIFGNRWTEIAKVVSGRTDNAVKNRFTTLCKKRAKYEALAKENEGGCINSNNKRVLLDRNVNGEGVTENATAAKRTRRCHIPSRMENQNFGDRSHLKSTTQQLRPPFVVLAAGADKVNGGSQQPVENANDVSSDAAQSKTDGTFIKKDDPKLSALVQQAELLSTLASKVNSEENTDQNLEHAWKVLQDFLKSGKGDEVTSYALPDTDFQLEDFKDLMDDLSSSDGSHSSWRQPDLYEASPASSEFSTGSSLVSYSAPDATEQPQGEIDMLQNDIKTDLQTMPIEGRTSIVECDQKINVAEGDLFPPFNEQTSDGIVVNASSSTKFGSPHQVTPLFGSLAVGIPSPQFSESVSVLIMFFLFLFVTTAQRWELEAVAFASKFYHSVIYSHYDEPQVREFH